MYGYFVMDDALRAGALAFKNSAGRTVYATRESEEFVDPKTGEGVPKDALYCGVLVGKSVAMVPPELIPLMGWTAANPPPSEPLPVLFDKKNQKPEE